MGDKPLRTVLRVVLIFCILGVVLAADIEGIFRVWEKRMRVLRQEIEQRLYSERIRPCDCSYHSCISRPDEDITRCLRSGHADSLQCSSPHCGYTKLSTSKAYVRVPPEVSYGFYSPSVNRDICLTEGLAESFRNLRQNPKGFAPWVYFGAAETGVFVSWPGRPREIDANDDCRPYDPRLRPWWRYTSWKNRNVVVLLGIPKTMKLDIHGKKGIKRWDLALSMTLKFLDTFSSEDTVQIILFGEKPERLLPDEGMLPATPENLDRLRSKLWTAQPKEDDYIDIGKALNATFKLLQTVTNPASKPCENHIVLFTDRRDCTSSTLTDCDAKLYFKKQTAEFVATGVEDSILLAEVLHRESKTKVGRSTLFAYSLAPDASTLTGQLACHLNGMHVDLERELREHGILDPLHLMRGYFMRAAVNVAKSFDLNEMAISELYDDDGGLGRLNTLVMPVYFRPKPKCPPIHFGNIGVDMPVSYYEEKNIDWRSRDFNLKVSNENYDLLCNDQIVDRCSMQVLRGHEEQCVYPIAEKKGQKCFQFRDHIYSVNYKLTIAFNSAIFLCEKQGGELIAPENLEERQFLATLAPPDGVWINLTSSGSKLVWPDGEAMEATERRNVQRTCVDDWAEKAFYMDARNYRHNIQCSQSRQGRPAVCKFPIDRAPSVCASNITMVSTDRLNTTIHTCEMEECLWEVLPDTDKKEANLICNTKRRDNKNLNFTLCCDEDDLKEVCVNDTEPSEKSDDDDTIWMIVVAVIIAVIVVLVIVAMCCICRRIGWFAGKGHRPLLSSDALSPKNGLMELPKVNKPLQSPFGIATYGCPVLGKPPELVMNIDVQILDNGWEKVGGYGRVRQGEYTDRAGVVHRVAVKFVDALAPEAAWEALRNEFDILSSIPLHCNIVKPFGAHWGDRTEQSARYIVEELMYTNLGDLMKGDSPSRVESLVYRDWIKIFIGIAKGLDHLHQHKIIHFDLKPRNVLLDEDLTAKIADFGCSKSKFDTYIELSKMAGTPPYLAPECWMLYYAQNCRTEVARIKIDVYSLGVIMWECLSGGSSLQTPLYLRPEQSKSSSKSTMQPDHIEIRRDEKSSGSNSSWEIQYHLRDEIPVSLRDLVNACIRLDFDARPTTSEILEILEPMLMADWIDRSLPWTT